MHRKERRVAYKVLKNLLTKESGSLPPQIFPMIKLISWNIRGMKSKKFFARLKYLVKINHVNFITLQEHFLPSPHIDIYRRGLSYDHVMSNSNSKV